MKDRHLAEIDKTTGVIGMPYHYEMVSDSKRVEPFARAIQRACKHKRVLESGTGSAIMSLLAAQAGADKVYTVERDPVVFRVAEMNIAANHLSHRIKLTCKDVREVTLADLDGEKVDVVIAENLSTWQISEPQISIMNHINRNLARPDAVRLPGIIENCVELVHAQFDFLHLVTVRSYYFEFTGTTRADNLSRREVFTRLSMSEINPPATQKSIVMNVEAGGILNAVRLTSPLRIHGDISFESSDSLMPPVIMPLEQDLEVEKGDRVEISIRYPFDSDWSEFMCHATLQKRRSPQASKRVVSGSATGAKWPSTWIHTRFQSE